MTGFEVGRKDAETDFFLWMCRYDTSIRSLECYLLGLKHGRDYINGYVSYIKEYS